MANRKVAVGEVEMAVLEAGAGGDPLLLVHGFVGAKEDFADHLEVLAALGWHCVAPDLRGHGESSKPDEHTDYGLATFAEDIVGLADALGWDRFVLLGHSMGGMVAQHVAAAHAERLRGLVLMDTGHGPVEVDRESVELGKQIVGEGGMPALVDAQRKAGPGPLDTPASIRLQQDRPGYREFCERKGLGASDAMWLGVIDELLGCDDRLGALAGLTVPTLVIVGEQDAPFVPASSRMAATIPGAQLAVIPDAGHSPQFENPEPWLEALTGFLAEVGAEATA